MSSSVFEPFILLSCFISEKPHVISTLGLSSPKVPSKMSSTKDPQSIFSNHSSLNADLSSSSVPLRNTSFLNTKPKVSAVSSGLLGSKRKSLCKREKI